MSHRPHKGWAGCGGAKRGRQQPGGGWYRPVSRRTSPSRPTGRSCGAIARLAVRHSAAVRATPARRRSLPAQPRRPGHRQDPATAGLRPGRGAGRRRTTPGAHPVPGRQLRNIAASRQPCRAGTEIPPPHRNLGRLAVRDPGEQVADGGGYGGGGLVDGGVAGVDEAELRVRQLLRQFLALSR